jgi:hypothetical protein
MIRLNGRTLLLGGFHDHWARADMENPALFLAALNYYHYDFVTLMDGPETSATIRLTAEAYSRRLRVYPGREEATGWAHIVTINPRAPALEGDSQDIPGTLRRLRATCDLVLLAHPNYIAWEPIVQAGLLDGLLDQGLLDGVQLVPAPLLATGFGPRDGELCRWYRARVAAGKRTAVVGGWDLHTVVPAGPLPPVLYTRGRSPDGHFETPCDNRSIVFADENSLEAICAAVRSGDTVVENLQTGELLGPPDLVDFLTRHGYRGAVAELDAARDAVSLTVSRPWIGGETGEMSVNQAGTLLLPRTLAEAKTCETEAGSTITLQPVPVLQQRDLFHAPVVWRNPAGAERIWAVEITHPVQFDVLPWLGEGGPAIEILPSTCVKGVATVEAWPLASVSELPLRGRTLVPVAAAAVSPVPVGYRCTVRTDAGVERVRQGDLTFIPVTRFQGDWAAIPSVGVDEPRYAPRSAYGAKRPWPGPDVYSARLRFAWTDAEFMFQADVCDAVHFQPFEGHYTYNADCLQLALDPMLRRRDLLGNIYSFNLALTPRGPELFRWQSPMEEATSIFRPPAHNVSLGNPYLSVQPTHRGLLYELRLPWAELAPLTPAAGARMGIYFIMMNNNGGGLIDTLHWPVPIIGMWTTPSRWGVLTLLG